MAKLLCLSLPSLGIMLHRNMNLMQALSAAPSPILTRQEHGLAHRPLWRSGSDRGYATPRYHRRLGRAEQFSSMTPIGASGLILLR